eukprot:764619-Hanusia_phi.AAC.1
MKGALGEGKQRKRKMKGDQEMSGLFRGGEKRPDKSRKRILPVSIVSGGCDAPLKLGACSVRVVCHNHWQDLHFPWRDAEWQAMVRSPFMPIASLVGDVGSRSVIPGGCASCTTDTSREMAEGVRRVQVLTRLTAMQQTDMVTLQPGWTFLSAEDSHEYSKKLMQDKYGVDDCMSGEPCGRQIWVKQAGATGRSPTFDPSKNPNSSDLLYREQRLAAWKGRQPETSTPPKTAKEAAEKAIRFYSMLQNEDGHWGGDYAGPMFLMPGLIFTCYITGVDLAEKKEAMIAYLCNHQQEDGGWGTHIESPSTMFGSVLSYVSLRLLGLSSNHPALAKGRKFIQANGGAVRVAVFLSTLRGYGRSPPPLGRSFGSQCWECTSGKE